MYQSFPINNNYTPKHWATAPSLGPPWWQQAWMNILLTNSCARSFGYSGILQIRSLERERKIPVWLELSDCHFIVFQWRREIGLWCTGSIGTHWRPSDPRRAHRGAPPADRCWKWLALLSRSRLALTLVFALTIPVILGISLLSPVHVYSDENRSCWL